MTFGNREIASRCGWACRATLLATIVATLGLGCGDDDAGVAGESGGEGGANVAMAGAGHGGSIGASGAAADDPAFAVVGDRRIPYTPVSDLAFAKFFIAHHEMAIQMAEDAADRGSNAEVISMAESMIATQTAEVTMLEEASRELSDEVPPEPADPHADAELDHMKNLSGADLDREFLLEMIPHHASALAPAHRAADYLESPELKDMANSIIGAQAAEIAEMYALLVKLGGKGAGEDMGPDDATRLDFGLVGDRRIPLTPADDVELIDFFVPHHEMAVQMADHEIAHGKRSDVIAMAKMMKDAQSAEIELMRDKREALGGSAEPEPMPVDPHMEDEMANMLSMTGSALDEMFLREMLVHHSSALPTSHRAKPHVADPDLQDLVDAIFEAQAKEIGELQMMLDEL
jgi:uncharacterized protein (DUF305 family)